jgi:hypothetical protein
MYFIRQIQCEWLEPHEISSSAAFDEKGSLTLPEGLLTLRDGIHSIRFIIRSDYKL